MQFQSFKNRYVYCTIIALDVDIHVLVNLHDILMKANYTRKIIKSVSTNDICNQAIYYI